MLECLKMNNYIYAYYQAIQNGSVVVGMWIKLFYGLIIRWLDAKEVFFDAKRQIAPSNLSKISAITARAETIF